MSLPYQERDILLLASNKKDLEIMLDVLLCVKPELECRIVGQYECDKALKELVRSKYPFKFIYPKKSVDKKSGFNGVEDICIAKCLYTLFLENASSDIKIELVEEFYMETPPTSKLSFDCNKKLVRIEKKYFESINHIESIIHTLFDIPPVYISYGNDEETEVLLLEIGKLFTLLFPHIKIKYDRISVNYRKSISSYIKNLVKGKNIILLINRKYLKSEYAMGEFISILENCKDIEELRGRIYPLVTKTGKCIYDAVELQEILYFWKKKRNRVLEAMKEDFSSALKTQLDLIEQIIKYLPNFADIIQDFYTLELETFRESKFFDLFWEIDTQLTKDGFISFYRDEKAMQQALGL